jgi:multisubunit Na+/H+ antiporter MnhF subunit
MRDLGRFRMLQCHAHALAIVLMAILFFSASVRAEVNVQGDPTAVRVVAKEATVSEVLNVLAIFGVRYDKSIGLDGVVNGTYRGPLEHVLSRVLNGYNYVIKMRRDGAIDVIVVGRTGDPPVAGRRPVEAERPGGREIENDFEGVRLLRWHNAARAHRGN